MDGVIVDTAEYHFRAWQHVFQQQGIDFTRGDFAAKFGQRNDAIIRSVIGGEIGDAEVGRIAKMKEDFFRDMARTKVRAWPGAVELVQRLTEQGWPQALATSAPPENIELQLGSLDLKGSFQQIVSGQEVTASKPSPQVFQRAAEKLGVLPAQCIVIEDAVAGVAAAKAAGMHCIAVTTSNPGQALRGADLVVDSLTEVTVSMLKQLLVGIK
jgi:beta-phosphoglucomutase